MAEIIEMPKLSDTMTTGTLVKWLKKEGDKVSSGEMIAEVETDKATMEVENFEDGVILKIYAQEGDSVPIGGPICAVGEEGEEAPEVEAQPAPESDEAEESDDDADEEPADEDGDSEADEEKSDKEEKPKSDKKTEKKADKKAAPAAASKAPAKSAVDSGVSAPASPLARKVAADLGVDLSRVKGTGPGGRIVRADVEEAAKNPAAHGVAIAGGSAVRLGHIEAESFKVTNMRASIAKALVKSKTEAPHFYLQSEVDAKPLADMRADLNSFLADLDEVDGGIKYTVNDLILRAAALAVLKVPAINRTWKGTTIEQHGSVHLAFGVAIDDGLVTPVIRDADQKSLREISIEAKELIGKARSRKLTPDEMSGSTLTVTNLGMFGITDFYGIINPGNAAILSVGATVRQPVVDAIGQITVGYRMKVGLSGDHRVIDGALGAVYLQALGNILQRPSILLA